MKRKKKTLFDPDGILTRIHQAVEQDLTSSSLIQKMGPGAIAGTQIQLREFKKKYVSPKLNTTALETICFESFKKTNEHMGDINTKLRIILHHIRPLGHPAISDLELYLYKARALCYKIMGDFEREDWYALTKHSSGTSIDVPYKDTSMERKMKSPISATYQAIEQFEKYLQYDTGYRDAIHSLNQGDERCPDWDYKIVQRSKATTVDKTEDKRRMICIEPTVNMFLQQGLMTYITKRFEAFTGLSLSTLPDQHQTLARVGSIDGKLATIDFSSASDCVSIELLRWILPPRWFSAIESVRCSSTDLNGEVVDLNMISTMGNATTFPLETVVFWIMGMVCQSPPRTRSLLPEWEINGSVSVFGDDCIIPTNHAQGFMSLCTDLGFIVNEDKSFFDPDSRFRESCGGDYLNGVSVRAFHVRAPSSMAMSALEPWLYIINNRMMEQYNKYAHDSDFYFASKLLSVTSTIFKEYNLRLKIVPFDFPDDAGLKTQILTLPFRYARVGHTESGLSTFQYCKFRYWEEEERFDEIRYNAWLKTPIVNTELVFEKYLIRERGGYVVAKSCASWAWD
jgi:hypothetical protein